MKPLVATVAAAVLAGAATAGTNGQYVAAKEKAFFNAHTPKPAHVNSVTCAPYLYRHVYLCTFKGVTVARKPICVKDYAHYDGKTFNVQKETFSLPWLCGTTGPNPIPYPGDPLVPLTPAS